MTEHDKILDHVIETLKQPVTIDAGIAGRVMSQIEQLPAPSVETTRSTLPWWARRWTVRVSPLSGLAAAAALAAVALSLAMLTRKGTTPAAPPVAAATAEATANPEVTQFVLVAPGAKSVTLVGDFNDWSTSATRLVRQAGDGVWWITIPLPPGRYRYAFIVDGNDWRNDPNAPAAEDDFGRANSVITVGGA